MLITGVRPQAIKEYELTGEFDYCEVYRGLTPVDVDSICDIRRNYSKIANEFKEMVKKSAIVDYRNRSIYLEEELRITRQKGRESFMYHWYKTAILTRALTKVHGTAWYCKMELRKRTYRTSFWVIIFSRMKLQ